MGVAARGRAANGHGGMPPSQATCRRCERRQGGFTRTGGLMRQKFSLLLVRTWRVFNSINLKPSGAASKQ
jgi:hypothetical protein